MHRMTTTAIVLMSLFALGGCATTSRPTSLALNSSRPVSATSPVATETRSVDCFYKENWDDELCRK